MTPSPTGELPFQTTAPLPDRPVLLTGPGAAVLLDGTGEVQLRRESRGGLGEWGGVYAEGIRLTGPWTVRFDLPGAAGTLAGSLQELTAFRWGARSRHRVGALVVEQTIAPLDGGQGPAAVGRQLLLRTAEAAAPLIGRVVVSVEPFLAPVILEGIEPYEYHLSTRGSDLVAESHGFGLAYHSDPLPSRLAIDGRPWIGGRRTGEAREVRLEYDVKITPEAPTVLNWVIAGGLGRSVPVPPEARAAYLGALGAGLDPGAARESEWIAATPQMSLPGEPVIEAGYRLARGALHQLYQTATPSMAGLVAGYPWYAALWGRDQGWMLPAVLWLGDWERVRQAIGALFRYQARTAAPILGAAAGEVPMQVTSGPIFLFGTADTTLYPAGVVRRYVETTGMADLPTEVREALRRAAEWADAKVDPASGLLAHGGEVASIKAAAQDAGRVHVGFDAVDTTIWDSTDRRDHAIDVQVLYLEMLRARADLARWSGDVAGAQALTRSAESLAGAIGSRYAWPREQYLYDSLHRDGRPVAKVRPNALRAVSAGLFGTPAARALVARAAADDLATPWGLRTLSRADPTFDPQAYHDGQVWPIATGWAADAALACGDVARGLGWLRQLAALFAAEGGYANECYRGDRPEPFDSCFLLGLSIAPFLTTLFDRLWGIEPHLAEGTVRIEPTLPDGPTPARLTGVRLGDGALDLTWFEGRLTVRWSGHRPLKVVARGTEAMVAPGGTATLPPRAPKPL